MEEICQQLSQLAAQGGEIKILNLYKGLPISYPATILEVGEKTATFQVHKYQAACLYLQRSAYLMSKGLPNLIQARLYWVDVSREATVLTGFTYPDQNIGKRNLIRVQPEEPLQVEIHCPGLRLRGDLADISTNGIAIYTHPINLPRLSVSLKVNLSLKLPSHKDTLTLPGVILHRNHERAETVRLGIATAADANTKTRISYYITTRQSEISRELQQICQKLSKPE